MTQEDKELLLKDLCARLPYDVCVHIRYKEGEPCYGKLTVRDIQWFIDSKIKVIKPYLRPLSSMTEEEWKECEKCYQSDDTTTATLLIDFYNKKMFDYRGLIPMGLALEAPADMYNIKEK